MEFFRLFPWQYSVIKEHTVYYSLQQKPQGRQQTRHKCQLTVYVVEFLGICNFMQSLLSSLAVLLTLSDF